MNHKSTFTSLLLTLSMLKASKLTTSLINSKGYNAGVVLGMSMCVIFFVLAPVTK